MLFIPVNWVKWVAFFPSIQSFDQGKTGVRRLVRLGERAGRFFMLLREQKRNNSAYHFIAETAARIPVRFDLEMRCKPALETEGRRFQRKRVLFIQRG